MPTIPTICERCGSDELYVAVKAWAIYKNGQYYTLDTLEAVEVDEDAALATCVKCDAEIVLAK